MRLRHLAVCLLYALALIAGFVFAQQLSAQQDNAKVQATLNNPDVLDMQNAGLGTDIIVAKIKSSRCDFDTSPAALKELRGAGLPNEVILAMVQAPVNESTTTSVQPPQVAAQAPEHPRGYLGITFGDAPSPTPGAIVKNVAPDGPAGHAGIREGDIVEAANGQSITNAKDYQSRFSVMDPGTTLTLKVLRDKREIEVTATTIPRSPSLVSAVKAISYKSLPYFSKSVYQISPGSSSTTCDGTTYGNIDATSRPDYSGGVNTNGTINANTTTNCTTTYQPPQQGEVDWKTIYNYNVVEGGGYRFVILCTASVRWSKCAYLIPGNIFAAEVKGSEMWITAYKNGDPKKSERVKYDILETAPAQ